MTKDMIINRTWAVSGLWRRSALVVFAFITAVHLWAVMFIRHRSWQSSEFLDYPLGCSDMQQCARFGSNLFGQSLVYVLRMIIGFYSDLYSDTLAVPRLDGVDVYISASADRLTQAIYVTILGVGVYLFFRKVLGSIVGALVATNGLLLVFSGFYLPIAIRFILRFTDDYEQVSKLSDLLRMQQLGFLMHYDYLIVPAYLSAIFVLKRLQEHRMKLPMCFGYAFLLASIYEGLVPVVFVAYLVMSIRVRSVSPKYLIVLIAGQVTATVVAYGAQFGNGEVNWVGGSVANYGADNIEYLPQLVVLFALIIATSFGVGRLVALAFRLSGLSANLSAVRVYRGLMLNMVAALLVLHILGIAVAGYTDEAVRQSLGLQAMVFALGLTFGSSRLPDSQ